MATKRIKDLTNTATSVASDSYLAIDGTSNGTEKITRDNFRQDTADAFVAAPGTYNLAPLSGGAVEVAKGGTGSTTAAGARTNLSVNSIDEDAQANALKVTAPAMYFNGSSSVVTVADDDKLTFSSSTEFGTNSSGTWSPNDNTPALTDGTGTLNQHYRVDSGAGTVTQGGSTLSIINGTATTAGQAVYYDGSVWRLKDVDDLPFSVSALVNATDWTNFGIAGKYSNSADAEWLFYTNGDSLAFYLNDSNPSNRITCATSASLTAYEGQWIHVAVSYAGAGPSAASGNAFTAADAGVKFFINGTEVAQSAAAKIGTYSGMQNTSLPLHIGKYSTAYAKGSIRDVKIFNRELTADEVAELARGNDLGFSEEWGGALGGVFTQDSTPSGEFAGVNLTDADEAGPIGGKSNVLKLTVNTASGVLHYATFSGASGTAGKRLRLKCNAYVPSANSNADRVWLYQSSGSAIQEESITPDTWVPLEFEFVSNGNVMVVAMLDGASSSFADAGSDDILYLADLTVTEIGCLADFRAERYDTSTSKLYDISDNAFVGTGTSVSLTGREQPVYETGTWTPVYSPSSGSFTALTMDVTDATYTRVGNIVTVSANIKTDDVDVTGASGNLQITGLPFTANGIAAGSTAFTNNWTTHPVACWVSDNSNTMFLGKQASLGGSTTAVQVSDMQDGTVANANNVYITATYQIK